MHGVQVSPIKKLLYTLVKLSKHDLDKRFLEAGVEITQLQYWVLTRINAKPNTVNEIARQFDIRPPSLIPVVDALEQSGYLVRKDDADDRRKIQLTITKAGRALLKTLPVHMKQDGLNNAFGKLTPTKQKQLLALLGELTANFTQ